MSSALDKYLLPIGTLLRNGTYRVERYLGSGGFGNTYLVRHLGLDAEMVVKEFFMKGVNLRSDGNTVTVSVPDNHATFDSQRAKFKKEAQRLWSLRSAHIVGVHDIFEENGTVYYSMDYIQGESLSERLRHKGGPFSESEVREILLQLLDALSVIHGCLPQPLFHLDIKPNNILQERSGRIVLIDFGASKQLSSSHEGVTSTLMTHAIGYSPMEQIDGKADYIGAWTDFYALGATLYRLLTYLLPPGPSDIIEEEDAFHFPSDVSAQMRQLILWMMQPNRRKRPQSVSEVKAWLQKEPEKTVQETEEVTVLEVIHSKTPSRPLYEDVVVPVRKPEKTRPNRKNGFWGNGNLINVLKNKYFLPGIATFAFVVSLWIFHSHYSFIDWWMDEQTIMVRAIAVFVALLAAYFLFFEIRDYPRNIRRQKQMHLMIGGIKSFSSRIKDLIVPPGEDNGLIANKWKWFYWLFFPSVLLIVSQRKWKLLCSYLMHPFVLFLLDIILLQYYYDDVFLVGIVAYLLACFVGGTAFGYKATKQPLEKLGIQSKIPSYMRFISFLTLGLAFFIFTVSAFLYSIPLYLITGLRLHLGKEVNIRKTVYDTLYLLFVVACVASFFLLGLFLFTRWALANFEWLDRYL